MRKKVIAIDINIDTYDSTLDSIIQLSENKQSSYVCVANVHMVIEAYKYSDFRIIVNNADITIPDGMPLTKYIKYIYSISQDRIAGMDLMPDLIKKCVILKKKIFLYGSSDKVLNKIISKVNKDYSFSDIQSYSPPFRELSDNEKEEIINTINNFNPDFIFVALGCPKQEKWMAEHKNKINGCMLGLGGAFEVYTGDKKRAPRWMQKYSLEWLYRFLQDPYRLWKRYLMTNSLFIYIFIKNYVIHNILGKSI